MLSLPIGRSRKSPCEKLPGAPSALNAGWNRQALRWRDSSYLLVSLSEESDRWVLILVAFAAIEESRVRREKLPDTVRRDSLRSLPGGLGLRQLTPALTRRAWAPTISEGKPEAPTLRLALQPRQTAVLKGGATETGLTQRGW